MHYVHITNAKPEVNFGSGPGPAGLFLNRSMASEAVRVKSTEV